MTLPAMSPALVYRHGAIAVLCDVDSLRYQSQVIDVHAPTIAACVINDEVARNINASQEHCHAMRTGPVAAKGHPAIALEVQTRGPWDAAARRVRLTAVAREAGRIPRPVGVEVGEAAGAVGAPASLSSPGHILRILLRLLNRPAWRAQAAIAQAFTNAAPRAGLPGPTPDPTMLTRLDLGELGGSHESTISGIGSSVHRHGLSISPVSCGRQTSVFQRPLTSTDVASRPSDDAQTDGVC